MLLAFRIKDNLLMSSETKFSTGIVQITFIVTVQSIGDRGGQEAFVEDVLEDGELERRVQ